MIRDGNIPESGITPRGFKNEYAYFPLPDTFLNALANAELTVHPDHSALYISVQAEDLLHDAKNYYFIR